MITFFLNEFNTCKSLSLSDILGISLSRIKFPIHHVRGRQALLLL